MGWGWNETFVLHTNRINGTPTTMQHTSHSTFDNSGFMSSFNCVPWLTITVYSWTARSTFTLTCTTVKLTSNYDGLHLFISAFPLLFLCLCKKLHHNIETITWQWFSTLSTSTISTDCCSHENVHFALILKNMSRTTNMYNVCLYWKKFVSISW